MGFIPKTQEKPTKSGFYTLESGFYTLKTPKKSRKKNNIGFELKYAGAKCDGVTPSPNAQ